MIESDCIVVCWLFVCCEEYTLVYPPTGSEQLAMTIRGTEPLPLELTDGSTTMVVCQMHMANVRTNYTVYPDAYEWPSQFFDLACPLVNRSSTTPPTPLARTGSTHSPIWQFVITGLVGLLVGLIGAGLVMHARRSKRPQQSLHEEFVGSPSASAVDFRALQDVRVNE